MTHALRLLACIVALCVVLTGPASAQSRDASRGLFVVSGVRVDVTAPDASQARSRAIDDAQRRAFERLARRLTTAEDQARLPLPQPDAMTLNRLVSGIDIEDERRSGTRYVGRLGVNFDPTSVRDLLTTAGFGVVETRGSPILIVAQVSGAAPAAQDLWRQAWEQGGYAQELSPITVAPTTVLGPADWALAAPTAQVAGAASAVFATATIRGGSVVAQLIEVSAGQPPRDRGSVQAPMQLGADGMAPAFQRLAELANARLQAEWKSRVGATTGPGVTRTQITAVALFSGQDEWARVKQALASVGTISEVRVDAIAIDGAQLSFSYVGTPEGLQAELRRYGVALESGPLGPTLRVAG